MNNKPPFLKQTTLAAMLLVGSSALLVAQTNQTIPAYPLERQAGLTNQWDKTPAGTTAGIQPDSQPTKINKASSLIGTAVKNQQGEDLGKIRDLVIDFNADRVAYVVLDTNPGTFSLEKLHALPLRAFQPSTDGLTLTLNMDKVKLANSEGLNKTNWPNMTNPVWGAEVQTFPADRLSTTNALELNRRSLDKKADYPNTQP